MNTGEFLQLRRAIQRVATRHYGDALNETEGGWFDGACWHFATALSRVFQITGINSRLAHISRGLTSGTGDLIYDHAIVVTESDEPCYWDADGPHTEEQMIAKMQVEGGTGHPWKVYDAPAEGFAPADESPLVNTLCQSLYAALEPVYYHVTPERNVVSIMKHGLLPLYGFRAATLQEDVPAIYAFPTLSHAEDALSGWLDEAFDDEDLVIIALQTGQMPRPSSVGFEVMFSEAIPSSAIVGIVRETGEPLNMDSLRRMTHTLDTVDGKAGHSALSP